jgi:type IV secretory pathway VirB2 component (pilin)
LTSSPLAFSKVPKEWRKVCQTLFTGTVAKVASLIAIVIGGYGFAHGEPGAKK